MLCFLYFPICTMYVCNNVQINVTHGFLFLVFNVYARENPSKISLHCAHTYTYTSITEKSLTFNYNNDSRKLCISLMCFSYNFFLFFFGFLQRPHKMLRGYILTQILNVRFKYLLVGNGIYISKGMKYIHCKPKGIL